uniref:testicular spindle-associated protein SHCBP1L-like n=1 Tax=Styela clava TaxID=7725 RepID=UPI00193A349C|nr:testicular spindle-associated protein SHCBP1L-like [Styela clava]XP_039270477.1 testicular spindle-associated protein SHCBP1L-like [Styela clava]
MATAAEPTQVSKDETEKTLEDGIEEIRLAEDDQPGTSGMPSASMAFRHLPRIVRSTSISPQARYEIFCKEFRIADCRPSQVLNRVHTYIEERLMGRKWLALWRGTYDNSFRHSIDILVEVDDVCSDQAHVSLFEPLMCSGAGLPQHVVEAQLEELDHTVDIVELHPITLRDDDPDMDDKDLENEEMEIKEIAAIVENVRFFFEHLRRDWDDEDEGDQAFDAYLRARLQLYYDVVTGCVPAPLVARYNRTMAKYIVRRKELLDYQSRIQGEGEPTNAEAVECWRKYYEVLMLSGLLQIWETLQLRAEGPCFPRVLRRTKGKRDDDSTVMHLVTDMLTPSMLRDFKDDTAILQHKTPQSALQQCYEGDTIILYPGIHSGEGFHELTESVTIKGVGKRKDIIVEAITYDDLFVNISAANVTMENITFIQSENTEGALRVESGCAVVTDCTFKCDGTGITVREGANLTMKNCTITGTRGAAIELMPGCTATLENNDITHIQDSDDDFDPSFDATVEMKGMARKGAVHLHVVEPPKVQMINNKIKCEGGHGVTVGKKKYSSRDFSTLDTEHQTTDVDSGDAPAANKGKDILTKLGVDLKNNTIEDISVGDAI